MRAFCITEVEPSGPLLAAVVELAHGSAEWALGPLPDRAFADRARDGRLLAAIQGDCPLGYVLYDLHGKSLQIVHLCVAPTARRAGVARALVEELLERQNRLRVVLACRRDYDANAVWESLGFRPQRSSRPGGSEAGHVLTVWVRDLSRPTTLDKRADDRPRAALDHNVFLDLHLAPHVRPAGAESRHLLEDWIAERVELCITDEVFHEINLHEDAYERDAEQRWATDYRNLSTTVSGWRELVPVLARLAPAADDRDHRHVARATMGGAAYLVSRDDNLLLAAPAIEEELSISVVRPEALIVRLDEMRSKSPYQPAEFHGTVLQQFAPPDRLHDELISSLLNHPAGERLVELRARLRPRFAVPRDNDVRIVQTRDGRTVAGFVRCRRAEYLEVPLLRVASGSRGADAIARQLVVAQRHHAAEHRLSRVVITDPHVSYDVLGVLTTECFEQTSLGWSCDA